MRSAWRIVALGALLACQGPATKPPRLIVGALRHGLDPFLAAHRLSDGTEIRADLIERTTAASVHVVQVRGSERPHRHVEHDVVVQLLRGDGVLMLDGTAFAMRAGDVVVVERGALHWFASAPGTTAIALATFAPPLDAPDYVPADVDSPGDRR